MKLCERIFNSPVGAKMVMAVTGLMLSGFVLAHLSGNLLIFAGPDVFNAYAVKMQSMGPLLWGARLGLLGVFLVHMKMAISLTLENRRARPIGYSREATIQASLASRYMIHTGLLMLAFICFHLAHYTLKITDPQISELAHDQAYQMVMIGFSNPLISGFYVLAMAALAAHLRHGVSSAFQSLGIYHGNINPLTSKLGAAVAAIVFFGFSSIPLAVLFGCVK